MLYNNTSVNNQVLSMYTHQDVAKITARSVPNIIKVDSYKGEHWSMSADTDFTNAYVGFRRGESVCAMGLLSSVVQILDFKVTPMMVNVMEKFHHAHGGPKSKFNRKGWMQIANDFGGKIPLSVAGVREGTIVSVNTPLLNIRNTVKGFSWLVPYFLDSLMRLWKASSVSSNALDLKVKLYHAAIETGSTQEEALGWIRYALHDFGSRSAGGTSEEAAESGTGHQIHFDGSDNWEATWLMLMLYGTGQDFEEMNLSSGSVYAMEHNVILSHGKENEHALLLDEAIALLEDGRTGSVLVDTFNIDKAMRMFKDNLALLEEAWIKGGRLGKVVFRPDSGDAVLTPTGLVVSLAKALGLVGRIVLPSFLGVIQGDDVDGEMLHKFADTCVRLNIAMTNFVFGQGGALLNGSKRDDRSFAAKVNATEKDNVVRKVCKSPIYSPGKKSLEGYQTIVSDESGLFVHAKPVSKYTDTSFPCLYFHNGVVESNDTIETLKQRAHNSFLELVGIEY